MTCLGRRTGRPSSQRDRTWSSPSRFQKLLSNTTSAIAAEGRAAGVRRGSTFLTLYDEVATVSETVSGDGERPSRIVKTEDVLGGKPRVDGTRIGVQFLYERVEGRGLEPQTVADRHDIDVADVYRALAYYHDHPAEMADIQRDRDERRREAESDPDVATGPEDVA